MITQDERNRFGERSPATGFRNQQPRVDLSGKDELLESLDIVSPLQRESAAFGHWFRVERVEDTDAVSLTEVVFEAVHEREELVRLSVFEPGVNSRPFSASPLANHVPREWGMTVPTNEFDRVVLD